MLMMILAAMTAIADAPKEAEPACAARTMLVSKTIEPEGSPKPDGALPNRPRAKGPAVLQPGCKPEPVKKKDYPMA